jgi:hypothetical protein
VIFSPPAFVPSLCVALSQCLFKCLFSFRVQFCLNISPGKSIQIASGVTLERQTTDQPIH